MIPLADLNKQNSAIRASLIEAFTLHLNECDFILGKSVSDFEEAFSNYCGSAQCIGVGNGTDALELILESLGLLPGQRVLLPAHSFAATLESVLRCGLQPVLVDVDENYLIDERQAQAQIDLGVDLAIVVHLYGHASPSASRLTGARAIIEDAAQGHGAQVNGVNVGNLGTAAAFSFYPGKNLGALGDAGAITVSDDSLSERIRRLANHGRLTKFDHLLTGRNSRLDSIQASFLVAKLALLDDWNAKRQNNARTLIGQLGDLEWLTLPTTPIDRRQHVWHQFVVQVDQRDDFRSWLHKAGISTGLHYPYCLADLPFCPDQEHDTFPNARALAKRGVSIPVGEHLADRDLHQIVDAVRTYPATIAR